MNKLNESKTLRWLCLLLMITGIILTVPLLYETFIYTDRRMLSNDLRDLSNAFSMTNFVTLNGQEVSHFTLSLVSYIQPLIDFAAVLALTIIAIKMLTGQATPVKSMAFWASIAAVSSMAFAVVWLNAIGDPITIEGLLMPLLRFTVFTALLIITLIILSKRTHGVL